jgi:uncharacterized protein YjiS (DUF1127 family)
MPCADCLPGALEPALAPRPCSEHLTTSRAARLAGRIRCSLSTVWRNYWRRRVDRAAIFMLQSLDNRMLKDIGIDRSEIASVVRDVGDGRRGRRTWHAPQ